MVILSWVWNNRYVVGLALALVIGWHGHTIYYGYLAEKTSTKVIKDLGKGQAEIVDFNQDFNKVRANVKDDCIDRVVPDSVVRLLK